MNDRFLEKFREKPRPEFARDLHDRLHQQDIQHGRHPGPGTPRRIVQGISAALMVLAMTLLIMPGVFAGALGVTTHYVSGLTVQEVDRYTADQTSTPSDRHIRLEPVVSLVEARRIAGFQFQSPNWIPENFVAQKTVMMAGQADTREVDRTALPGKEIYLQPSAVGITYRDTRSPRRIQVWAVRSGFKFDNLPSLSVGRGSFEMVSIHLRPAALVIGQWNNKTQRWDNARGGYLAWGEEGINYYLVVTGGRLSKADLMKMAQSIK